MFRFKLVLLLVSFFSAISAATADAQVIFANMSNSDVNIARQTYYDGKRGGGNGGSTLAFISEPGWNHEGWFILKPGKTMKMPEGYYYVSDSSGQISYNGKSSVGYVKPEKFHAFVLDANAYTRMWGEQVPAGKSGSDRVRQGFQQVNFQYFSQGLVQVYRGTPAYSIKSQNFNYRLTSSSRSRGTVATTIAVPGAVVGAEIVSLGSNEKSKYGRPKAELWGDNSIRVSSYMRGVNHSFLNLGTRSTTVLKGQVRVRYIGR